MDKKFFLPVTIISVNILEKKVLDPDTVHNFTCIALSVKNKVTNVPNMCEGLILLTCRLRVEARPCPAGTTPSPGWWGGGAWAASAQGPPRTAGGTQATGASWRGSYPAGGSTACAGQQ